jgi:hypothetical protein
MKGTMKNDLISIHYYVKPFFRRLVPGVYFYGVIKTLCSVLSTISLIRIIVASSAFMPSDDVLAIEQAIILLNCLQEGETCDDMSQGLS